MQMAAVPPVPPVAPAPPAPVPDLQAVFAICGITAEVTHAPVLSRMKALLPWKISQCLRVTQM